jgi:HAMP domain-containing protein
MRRISAPHIPPFPQPRFAGGVHSGPLAMLIALLAGVLALLAVAVASGGNWPDWRLPAVLAVVAVVGHALLWAGLVAPVRRFGDAMARMVTEDRADVVPRSRATELDRVAVALYRFHRIRPGRRSLRSRRHVPLAVAPCLAAVLVLSWAIPAAAATVRGVAPQADLVAHEAGAGAGARAQELGAALRDGLGALERAADPPTGAAVADPATTAAQALEAEPLFRSVSVVGDSGQAVATAGRAPAAPLGAVGRESRVVQANTSGAEPLVVATTPMWDGTSTLVAEFDPRGLNNVIRADGVHTRVVDARQTTVLDTSGYTAFEPLDDPALGTLAASASTGSAPAVATPEGERVAAAARVGAPGSVTDVGWVLVEDQDAAAAAFAGDTSRRATVVVIAVSASLALAALAWTAVTVVAPARRLVRHVEALAAGTPVPPLATQRLDEIGTAVAATNRFAATRARPGAVVRA